MCLAIPFQLIQVNGKTGIGEAAGVQRKIRLDFIREPKVGDYVISHAGFAIERLNEKQALENLEAISEAANAV
jgi:hydrogenase expression/formation protein HypC